MGRTKGYDRDDLIQKATALFHRYGYAGTSTQMLVEALGVNRNSMYSEFGSKQKLFELVLENFESSVFNALFGPLEGDDAGLAEIETLLKWLVKSSTSERRMGLGCMLTNCRVEFGARETVQSPVLQNYFERITHAFEHALKGAKKAGEFPETLDIRQKASALTVTSLGIFVLIRAKATPDIVAAAVERELQYLDGQRHAL